MSLYEMVDEPQEAVAPALIVAFEDWVDAGGSASTAARRIAYEGEVVARFDTDAIYDYRSHRPVLDIVSGRPVRFAWQEMNLVRRRLPERDIFVLTGPEPDARWKQFADSVLELAVRLGVVEYVSLGSIPTAIPHTAPTPVMMTASSEDLLRGQTPTEGLLRVPAAAVSLVEWTLASGGIPAVGFWAQVPHYASPYAAGAIALIRKVENHLTVTIGAGELEEEAAIQRKTLEEILAGNPEARTYVERLQSMVGEPQVPAAEELAAEVERFLRNQRRPGPGSNPFDPT